MCATFELKNKVFKPGREVIVRSINGIACHVWAGFARNESLGWWIRQGGVLLDIPADRFAERSDLTRKLLWDEVPADRVVRGVMDLRSSHPLVKVVTRASSEEEWQRFEHPRMPLLERALYPGFSETEFWELLDRSYPEKTQSQVELF
jgi:hypothetical protein